uniref:Coluporin-18 n=1 Tax=Colubraria reticulata TaxID=604273 RepID=A0A499RLU9_9CAEN|nr:coluporin-18 [Colubraria reticulata]
MALQFPRSKTLLVIFLFVIGFPAGRSSDSGYTVTAEITVENRTPNPLIKPYLRISKGVNLSNPVDIRYNSKGTFTVRKPAIHAEGTFGTVSWIATKHQRRFVVMWSVPFDLNLYSNWMGLGMTMKGKWQARTDLFKKMYNEDSNGILTHVRKEFCKDTRPVNLMLDGFNITGTMTCSNHAKINVLFQLTNKN